MGQNLNTTLKTLRFYLVYLLLAALTAPVIAQEYAPLPPRLDGSMMPIDFSTFTQPPYLPDSLRPVYSCYVARHGARYLSGPQKLKPVVDALQAARNAGTLSDEGDAFFTLIDHIREANNGNWGDLSPLGYKEERRLGERLFDILTPLGGNNPEVTAVSSYVPRCVMTMYLLTNSLLRCNDRITVSTDEGRRFDRLLCCFSADSAYADYRKNGNWKPVYERFVKNNVSPAPARRLFTSTDLSEYELQVLTLDIYEVLKANRAADLTPPSTRWMSEQEYYNCWRASNLQHYLRNNITLLSDLAGRATLPLLDELITKIDHAADMDYPNPVLDTYFGHAETLLPLLSLMQLPGCYMLTDNFDTLEREWKIEEITPLGGNLMILLSRGPSGLTYVSLQLNGRDIRPIKGKPDIVAWSDLREFWLKCAESLR